MQNISDSCCWRFISFIKNYKYILYLYHFNYRVTEVAKKYGLKSGIVWHWYFQTKIGENMLIFSIFAGFYELFVIYNSFSSYVLIKQSVHRLTVAQLMENGLKTSWIVFHLKVLLQTVQKIIKQWKSVRNLYVITKWGLSPSVQYRKNYQQRQEETP